jgi:hypothetical protein
LYKIQVLWLCERKSILDYDDDGGGGGGGGYDYDVSKC